MRLHSLRLRLTLLYAVPFFFSGALVLAIPLFGVRESVAANAVGTPVGPTHPTVHQPLVASAIGLGVMAVISLGLGWWIANRFLRPLRTIIATARDISATNLHRRLNLRGRRDEFTDLADTLDGLFGRLQASFESQRHFVANASHELRTPLTAERALLQVALADPEATTQTLRSTCEDVLSLGLQQERLIEALLTLATGEQGVDKREPLDLADIAGSVLGGQSRAGIQIDASLEPAPAMGDPKLVESLVANLVENALRHNVPSGRVEVATAVRNGRACISVSNTGPIIPADQVERLLEPFQQMGTARVGRGGGHGLGLAIVRAITKSHGATLALRPRVAGGLDVEVGFP